MNGKDEIASLKAEITTLLAAAACREIDHTEATKLASEAHQAEVDDLVETARQFGAVHPRERSP